MPPQNGRVWRCNACSTSHDVVDRSVLRRPCLSPPSGASDPHESRGHHIGAHLVEHYRLSRQTARWAAHCAFYISILLALSPYVHLETSFLNDEGAIPIQARAMLDNEGEWFFDEPSASLASGEFFSYRGHAVQGDDGIAVSITHPFHVLLVVALANGFGLLFGLYLPTVVGAACAASAAWWLSVEAGSRRPTLAFWISGLSPLLFYAFIPLGHAPAAGLVGLSFAAGARASRTLRWRWILASVCFLVIAVLFRREVVLAGFALAVGALVIPRTSELRLLHPASAAAVLAGVPVLAWRAEQWVSTRITGANRGSYIKAIVEADPDFVGSRIDGLMSASVKASPLWSEPRSMGALIILLSALLIGALLRRHPTGWLTSAVLLWTVAIYTYWTFLPARETNGLAVAWPIGVVALVQWRRRRPFGRPVTTAIAVSLVVFCLLTLLLQAPGDHAGWGPRYFMIAIAPASVLVAMGGTEVIASLKDRANGPARYATFAGLLLLIVLPSIAGLRTLHQEREREADIVDQILTLDSDVAISEMPLLPRSAWRAASAIDWYLTSGENLPVLLSRLRNAGVQDVVVVVEPETLDAGLPEGAIVKSTRYFAWDGVIVAAVAI